MSFSKPELTTPAQKFFKWKGGVGEVVWYDKEEKKEFTVTLPFRFLVLDELTTIKGYSDLHKSGIWSNEIRSMKQDVLHVKSGGGVVAVGQYDSIKDTLKAQGGKFARSVYIAYQEAVGEDGEWKLGNINIAGAALGEWFDFRKKNNLNVNGVVIDGKTEDKKGATKFFVPTFNTWNLDPIHFDIGNNLDAELQKYLETYLNRRDDDSNTNTTVSTTTETFVDVVLDADDIDDDKPIDLSEIPF